MASDSQQDIEQLDPQHEDPSVWGWHGEFGRGARAAGWVVAVILLLMITATHYNGQGTLFLAIGAGILVVMLIWDRQRRKNAWRK